MQSTRVKISNVVKNQLPNFVRETYPLVEKLFQEYYAGLEYQGGVLDILQNIDKYVKLDNIASLIEYTELTQDISFADDSIRVSSTRGFPDSYGLIQIDSEVILYKSKTYNTFNDCVRGFSAITSYEDGLDFQKTNASDHLNSASVKNLNILFLNEFFKKIKTQFAPGFENRKFFSSDTLSVNKNLLIKQLKDFYTSKGTDASYKILFKALFGDDVKVIKPRDYLIRPSDAQYRINQELVIEAIEGDPKDLVNTTIFQNTLSIDGEEFISSAYGTVNKVETITRKDKTYYTIGLDFDFNKDINLRGSVYGEFVIGPKTIILERIDIGSSSITVDSTYGFPETNGKLVVYYEDGTTQQIDYQRKNLNQFLGCSGINRNIDSKTEIYLDYVCEGGLTVGNDENPIKFRITGVLSDPVVDKNSRYIVPGNRINLRTLGKDIKDPQFNCWRLNISPSYKIKNLSLINTLNNIFRVQLSDKHLFNLGDGARLISTSGLLNEYKAVVESIVDDFSINVSLPFNFDSTQEYNIEREISKFTYNYNSEVFDNNDIYITDTQNTYRDSGGSLYLASQSLPKYGKESLIITDDTVVLGEDFFISEEQNPSNPQILDKVLNIGKNAFVTGDALYYQSGEGVNSLNIANGVYYVKALGTFSNSTKIKLSSSRSNLDNSIFIDVSVNSPTSKLTGNQNKIFKSTNELIFFQNQSENSNQNFSRKISPKNIFKKVSSPEIPKEKTLTPSGTIGVLANGVEIANYKSNDFIYYGSIQKIDVKSLGSGYDVINPPILNISDKSGTGASVISHVQGFLEKIDVLGGGFDWDGIPEIKISGGNGFGAIAIPEMTVFDHFVEFVANTNQIDVTTATPTSGNITFSIKHKFYEGERILYDYTDAPLEGLEREIDYFVSPETDFTLKVYKNFTDSINRENAIEFELDSLASGKHFLKSANKKSTIGSIKITRTGENYTNKKIVFSNSNVDLYKNSIKIEDHGYKTGEVIVYNSSGSPISGLSTNTEYYVNVINSNEFNLCGINTVPGNPPDFNLKRSIFVNFENFGSGSYEINYRPIRVDIVGNFKNKSLPLDDIKPNIIPAFRGSIVSTCIENSGLNYGSSDILNYNRQPNIEVRNGSGAELKAIISNGQIKRVLIVNGGSFYNSTPTIEIQGEGSGAKLVPIISNGRIVEVNVISEGINYKTNGTLLNVISSGSGASFDAVIQKWNVNSVERAILKKQILNNDVFLLDTKNEYGERITQITHSYAPRRLREDLLVSKRIGGNDFYKKDLEIVDGRESITSEYHSPIIGWAYDGNPIYGPFGFTNPSGGGSIKKLSTGYRTISGTNRPSLNDFPLGFFVEDYVFVGDGDLDDYNGRFCVTPEFPNGIYAYFSSLGGYDAQFSTTYLRPSFPYFIGNYFKSKVIDFNFDISANQNIISFEENQLIRNTNQYNLLSDTSTYNYIFNPIEYENQLNSVSRTQRGIIETVDVISGGENYKVGDIIEFGEDENGNKSFAEVSEVKGKDVTSIILDSFGIENVEFGTSNNKNTIIGISSSPHGLNDNDVVNIIGLNELLTNKEKNVTSIVDVTSNRLVLNQELGVSTPNESEKITVVGNLKPTAIRSNDVYKIFNGNDVEFFKILNVDPINSQIRVLRSGVTTSYPSGTSLIEDPRVISVSSVDNNSTITYSGEKDYPVNKELYFNPEISVGVGTTTTNAFIEKNSSNYQCGISSDSLVANDPNFKVGLVFNNLTNVSAFRVGDYVSLTGSTPDITFNSIINKIKVLNVGINSIVLDYNVSSLTTDQIISIAGSGVTSYVDKWITRSIPSRSIYLKDHRIKTGDRLLYKNNGGSSILVSGPVALDDFDNLYAYAFDENHIGISTQYVGLSTTGEYLNPETNESLLYFVSSGTRDYHSFRTDLEVQKGILTRNIARVNTSSDPSLFYNENIFVNLKSNEQISVKVKYNDANRRLVFNPKSYNNTNLDKNTLIINNHGYFTGQKIIHNTLSPTDLENDKIYYVVVENENEFKLSLTYEESIRRNPVVIDLTTPLFGEISEVNPNINLYRNDTVNFDLTDSSLSFISNQSSVPAFDFDIYEDENFLQKFLKTKDDSSFEVTKTGVIGVTNNAKVTLSINDTTPKKLYYKLTLVNTSLSVPISKTEYRIDDDNIKENSTITILDSVYSGHNKVSFTGTSFFDYFLKKKPEKSFYSGTNASILYTTDSYSTLGEITKASVLSRDRKYRVLPGITSITSKTGTGALLFPSSNKIGSVAKVDLKNIGFDYSVDYSLRPTGNLPQLINVEPLSIFESIKVVSTGKDYTLTPNLVVIDGLSGKVDTQSELKFVPEEVKVEIIQNSSGLFNKTPIIIPINNSNGITVSSVSYVPEDKILTFTLNQGFSSTADFPFDDGDRVLLENFKVNDVNVDPITNEVTFNENVKGINSSNYNYALFTVSNVAKGIGGNVSRFSIDMSEYLEGDEIPGEYRPVNTFGYFVPEKYFPTFNITLQKNNFILGEEVFTSSGFTGIVEYWDRDNEFVSVLSGDKFITGDRITGRTSNLSGIVGKVQFYDAEYKVGSSSVVSRGWDTRVGFLNDNTQRIQDSFYYQYFSYDLKSKTQFSEWQDAVSSLNHASGFKKFSTFEVESTPDEVNRTSISYSELNSVSDIFSIVDINSYVDFDMVSENTYLLDGRTVSDQVVFNTIPVQDYAESINNRVLVIEDISSQFNNVPRDERFVVVDKFPIFQTRYRKYFAYVKDKLFFNERQFGLISLIHDDLEGYIGQYGQVETFGELGTFEFRIRGFFGEITFNPFDFEFNDFDIELVSYSLFDTFVGLGSTSQETYSLGTVVTFTNQTASISAGTTSAIEIARVGTEYKANKLLTTLNDENGDYRESVELNIVSDGNDVYITEYGKLFTKALNPPIGYAAYSARISGDDIIVEATPSVSYGATLEVNTVSTSIDTDFDAIDTDLLVLSNTRLESGIVNIGITTNTAEVHRHNRVYGGAYYYAVVTSNFGGFNSKLQALEIVTVNNDSDAYITVYGSVLNDPTVNTLGDFSVSVSGKNCILSFTPAVAGENIAIKFFYQGVKTITENPENPDELILDLNESQINSYTTDYIGTQNEIKRKFDLFYDGYPILRRTFNASSFTSVDLNNDKLIIPNHYFSTGEEVTYDTNGDDPIGIALTSVPGIGLTDILPPKLYIIKDNNLSVRVAASASQALKSVPDYLDLISYGTGTTHTLTGKRGNERSLITIDNMIQSPIVSTSFETTLAEPLGLKDVRVKVTNPDVFVGGDVFRVDDEILRVKVVGFGATNTLLVNRFWLGTLPSTHDIGAGCTKYSGDYNIVDNTIHFYDAPYGKVPITPKDPKPDEVDFVGISTSSSFSGRIFNKSGQINGLSPTYSDNVLVDDISEQFTGIRSEFTLTSTDPALSGVSTSNLFVLIKNILQIPFDEQRNIDGAFTLGQTPGGDPTIIFKQSQEVSNHEDINSTNLPSGGIIVSTGSTFGHGYQTLRTPGASVTIDNTGSISNITIGSTGSGYRLVDGKEIFVTTSTISSSGSNILTINEERSLFDKLPYSSRPLCSTGIGTICNDLEISSYDPITSTITLSDNLDEDIPSGSIVSIKLTELTSEIVDIGIRTESTVDYDVNYIGFTTVISGSISTNINFVNPGISFTSFYDVFETLSSEPSSIGSTVVYVNTVRNINNINNYISINNDKNVKIVGIGNTFITIDTPLTSNILSNEKVTIRRFSPPEIVFDSPIGYYEIPLIYSSTSPSIGIGTGAKINLVVGEEGRVIDFKFTNNGYGYRPFEVLTVPTGGLTGIPLDQSTAFEEFKLFIDDVYDTKFSAWSIGDLQVIDNFDDLFDNSRRVFPIKINGEQKSIRAKKGSNIDIQAVLLVLYNDILQVPGKGYTFTGGSIITFPEAPKFGDTVSIIFYRGNGDTDVVDVDVLESVKIGDSIFITSDDKKLIQNERIVSDVVSSDFVNTLIYNDRGISNDFELLRPITIAKQTEDFVIDNQFIGKDRVYYEPSILPSANLISDIELNSTKFYVDTLKPFFDNAAEQIDENERNVIKIIDSREKTPAIAGTCQVSNGEIISIPVIDGGSGYESVPNVTIQYPFLSNPLPRTIELVNIANITGTISTVGVSTAIIGEQILGSISGASGILAGITTDNVIEVLPTNLHSFVIGEEVSLFESGFSAEVSSTDSLEYATATANISAGQVDSITVTNSGVGYTYGPIKKLRVVKNGTGYPPVINEGNGTFSGARLNSQTGIGLNASIDVNLIVDPITENLIIDSANIDIVNAGFRYSVGDIVYVDTFDNPGIGQTFRNYRLKTPIIYEVIEINEPKVSIDPPTSITEVIRDVQFAGDYGVVVGISTVDRVTIPGEPPGISLDLYIPEDSILRDEVYIGDTVVGSAITISQLQAGDYLRLYNSRVGNSPNSSFKNTGSILSNSSNLDNVYQVIDSQIITVNSNFYGSLLFVNRILCAVANLDSVPTLPANDISIDGNIAEFSWGKIDNLDKRVFPKEFNIDQTINQNNPVVQRFNALKFSNYDY